MSSTVIARAIAVEQPTETLKLFTYQHGHQPDSYLASAPGREIFWANDRSGLVAYGQYGRHVLVSGGLIAPPADRQNLLEEFLRFVASRRLRATFFCIPEADLPIFRAAGYCANKIGEDATIDLPTATFAGKSFEWVRRQSNYCRRHGMWMEELRPYDHSVAEWTGIQRELDDVTRESMRLKPQVCELSFFDGTLGEHELGYRRLFVARRKEAPSRIEGYVVCNPILAGRSWSTEIYRHRPDAVRGTIPFLFHQIALQLKQEGAEQLNLCLIPARNCEERIPGDKALIRHSLVFFRKNLSLIFDLHGIDHFKSRFRPRYENRYVCSRPDPSIGAMIATVRAFGLFRICPRKLIYNLWTRRSKQRTHVTDTADTNHGSEEN